MQRAPKLSLLHAGCLLVFVSRLAAAQAGSSVEAEVLKADAAYREAVLRSDVRGLMSIMREDVVIVHSDGTRDSRAVFLDSFSSGRLRMQSYERLEVAVHIHGQTAFLVSRTKKTFKYKGRAAKADDSSLVIYVKEGTRWRMAAMQNTPRP